ncbi:NirD/YgiW/YdeI family stress tolerance protein [Seleniivibrio sp.]|uniref:NirD/YgiW/YdeI family stress tolerance protein n=1 Tax=Seleniivibrio sp. TaxID=2898801 RepID=UPI0025FAA879|nr:NirD/YgiW/YdeI family stress tolerance protein [Seleniivibrio sp.]MCD8554089.1 NirD/YgiW/YdeI family stress tolerance protein [Seleniivibrio sp.]
MRTIILGGLAVLSIFNFAFAQYIGPNAVKTYSTVEEVIKKPVDGAEVSFQGYLLKKVGNKKYIFSDGTGEIRVDIDNDIFPNVAVGAKTKVEVKGEIEKDFLESPEIDVDIIQVMEK